MSIASGKFVPPADLQPAIDALGAKGRKRLLYLVRLNNGKMTHDLIAKAADYERGESQSGASI